jgi:hypothetical protein
MTYVRRLVNTFGIALALTSLLNLSACFNDTPYSSGYSHITIYKLEGPGIIVMASDLTGTQTCTAEDNNCAYTNEIQAQAKVTFTAIPDEGHTFVGWSGDVKGNENPLILIAYRDYFFSATFK